MEGPTWTRKSRAFWITHLVEEIERWFGRFVKIVQGHFDKWKCWTKGGECQIEEWDHKALSLGKDGVGYLRERASDQFGSNEKYDVRW